MLVSPNHIVFEARHFIDDESTLDILDWINAVHPGTAYYINHKIVFNDIIIHPCDYIVLDFSNNFKAYCSREFYEKFRIVES